MSLSYTQLYLILLTPTCLFPTFSSLANSPSPFACFCCILCFKGEACGSDIRTEMADSSRTQEFTLSSQDHETTTTTGKKYGGLVPKKKPLISKDHERAFFDSADWALCKQGAEVGQKSAVAIETLRPKLERTPHQQLPPRRPACTS